MFFLTYILQYIFSLSKNTHTCPIFVFVCGFSWQQIGGGQTERVKKKKKITWCSSTWKNLRATASLTCRIHKMAAVGVCKTNLTNCGAVTTGTWSSRTPEQFPSPRSTRCRRCSGTPPSSFWSWWRHSKHPEAPLPGRIGDNPCEESCWWTCMFSSGGGASAAPSPSLLDMSALCHR